MVNSVTARFPRHVEPKSWLLHHRLVVFQMQLCKSKLRCNVLFIVQFAILGTVIHFNILTEVWDVAFVLCFPVSLSIARSDLLVNLLECSYLERMLHQTRRQINLAFCAKLFFLFSKVVPLADYLIMGCIWLAASYPLNSYERNKGVLDFSQDCTE